MNQGQSQKQEDILKMFDPLQRTAATEDVTLPQSKDKSDERIAASAGNDEEKADDDDEEPFYDFQKFSKQLQDPRAEPIVKYTKSFLRSFQTQRALWTANEQTKLINDFKVFVYDKFLVYEPFKSLDRLNLRNSQEGLEKLIMGKLYGRCFSPCLEQLQDNLDEGHKKDLLDDTRLTDKVAEYSFIKPQDLDIPSSLSERLAKFVKLSGEELDKVNQFKAPRDKMICVLNSCKVIFAILRHHKLEDKGADSFIPLLIFTILKGSTKSLVSNVRYIERFRYEEFIRGEASYYLNSLQAAINYIMTLDREAFLATDDGTFEQRYRDNQSRIQIKRTEENTAAALNATKAADSAIEEQSSSKLISSQSPLPSEYILHPLDEVTNAVMHKFNEFFVSPRQETAKPSDLGDKSTTRKGKSSDSSHLDINALAKKIEEEEHQNTVETLQSMFPEMDREIIEDVCIAKKYRVGASVDILLSL